MKQRSSIILCCVLLGLWGCVRSDDGPHEQNLKEQEDPAEPEMPAEEPETEQEPEAVINRLFPIRENDRIGYINIDRRVVIEPRYVIRASSKNFHEGMATLKRPDGKVDGINAKGEVVFTLDVEFISNFSEGFAAFSQSEMYGYIDMTGAVHIEPQYRYAEKFSEGKAAVQTSDLRCFYITPENANAFGDTTYEDCYSFNEGYAVVSNGDASGVIDEQGNLVVPFEHYATHGVVSNGLLGVFSSEIEIDRKSVFIDVQTNTVAFELPFWFAGAYEWDETLGIGFIQVGGRGSWGRIVDKNNEVIVDVGTDGNIVLGNDGLHLFSIPDPDRAYGRREGYMTLDGEIVVPAEFDSADLFYDGLARILKGKKRGYLVRDSYETFYDEDVLRTHREQKEK